MRQKGLSPFSGNFEPQYAGPFDARDIVELKSDLTNPDTWLAKDGSSYIFIGMTTTVSEDTEENNGIYRFKGGDATDINNWVKEGSSGGSGPAYDDTEVRNLISENTEAINTKANTSDLSTVATSGSYDDLSDKPVIPDTTNLATKAEVDAKQDELTAQQIININSVPNKANTSDLSTVATSGSYDDLSDKPVIPDTTNLATKAELDAKQNELTAGANISIIDDVISSTGVEINAYTKQETDNLLNTKQDGLTVAQITNINNVPNKANTTDLSTVATSGNYNDLLNRPTIPSITGLATETYVDSGLNRKQDELTSVQLTNIDNIPNKANTTDLSTVATSGNYNDLINRPTIPDASNFATKAELADKQDELTAQQIVNINNVPNKANTTDLSTVATSGNYNDLLNRPTIPDTSTFATKAELADKQDELTAQQIININSVPNKANTSDLSTVATSGSYDDLSDKPVIPDTTNLATKAELDTKQNELTAQQITNINSVPDKANTSDLSTVATSGSYDDLSDKPVIPDTSTFATKAELDTKAEADVEIEITLAQIGAGMVFEDHTNYSIPLSTPLVTASITSAYGPTHLSFVAGASCTITIPSDNGWNTDTAPSFVLGKYYQIAVVNGTWYADGGRT